MGLGRTCVVVGHVARVGLGQMEEERDEGEGGSLHGCGSGVRSAALLTGAEFFVLE